MNIDVAGSAKKSMCIHGRMISIVSACKDADTQHYQPDNCPGAACDVIVSTPQSAICEKYEP